MMEFWVGFAMGAGAVFVIATAYAAGLDRRKEAEEPEEPAAKGLQVSVIHINKDQWQKIIDSAGQERKKPTSEC